MEEYMDTERYMEHYIERPEYIYYAIDRRSGVMTPFCSSELACWSILQKNYSREELDNMDIDIVREEA